MARLVLSKKKNLFYLAESVRCLLTVLTLSHVWLYLHLDRHYRRHVLKSESHSTPTSRQIQLRMKRSMLDVSSSIKKLVDLTLVFMEKIGNAMNEEIANRKQVVKELEKIEGLTVVDIMTAGKAIMSDSFMRALFLSRSSEKRKEMVQEVLKM